MNLIETILLSVSLAIDCFTVSVTSGIILHRIQWGTFLRMAFFFGLFQALMPFLGWLGASRFQHLIEAYDHWIAFALLAFLGIRMIRAQFKEEETASFNPTSLKVTLALAVATSIDALAIGISFAFAGFKQLEQKQLKMAVAVSCAAHRRNGTDSEKTISLPDRPGTGVRYGL